MSAGADGRIAVVLFTRDLRVHDHPGLAEAARSSRYVVPVFVLDDEVLDRAGPNRVAFLVEALADLRESLRQRGADLVIRRGDPVAETLRLCRDVGAGTVFVGEDVSPYARRREQRLATACRSAGVELRVEHGSDGRTACRRRSRRRRSLPRLHAVLATLARGAAAKTTERPGTPASPVGSRGVRPPAGP